MRKAVYTGSSEKPVAGTSWVSAVAGLVFTVLTADFCDFMAERVVLPSWENEIVALLQEKALLQDGICRYGLGAVYMDAKAAHTVRARTAAAIDVTCRQDRQSL
ncbi:hypothetical protein M2410_001616 [Stenotrophomonas chelatiphaga]|uniref:hypothetical protein n=1 Tax=Stenotrophomonas chelatiphaga TaxID=517011 RepID=UPI00160F415A|nr:hypothetical protein [Stenotrophomonas chelatiphaga]MCS4230888.1 hypothetical protein [Stenotrophomonas chelatiphaga]